MVASRRHRAQDYRMAMIDTTLVVSCREESLSTDAEGATAQ